MHHLTFIFLLFVLNVVKVTQSNVNVTYQDIKIGQKYTFVVNKSSGDYLGVCSSIVFYVVNIRMASSLQHRHLSSKQELTGVKIQTSG